MVSARPSSYRCPREVARHIDNASKLIWLKLRDFAGYLKFTLLAVLVYDVRTRIATYKELNEIGLHEVATGKSMLNCFQF